MLYKVNKTDCDRKSSGSGPSVRMVFRRQPLTDVISKKLFLDLRLNNEFIVIIS